MEAEMGMMQTEAEGCWQLVEAGRARNGFLPLEPPEGTGPVDTLILAL